MHRNLEATLQVAYRCESTYIAVWILFFFSTHLKIRNLLKEGWEKNISAKPKSNTNMLTCQVFHERTVKFLNEDSKATKNASGLSFALSCGFYINWAASQNINWLLSSRLSNLPLVAAGETAGSLFNAPDTQKTCRDRREAISWQAYLWKGIEGRLFSVPFSSVFCAFVFRLVHSKKVRKWVRLRQVEAEKMRSLHFVENEETGGEKKTMNFPWKVSLWPSSSCFFVLFSASFEVHQFRPSHLQMGHNRGKGGCQSIHCAPSLEGTSSISRKRRRKITFSKAAEESPIQIQFPSPLIQTSARNSREPPDFQSEVKALGFRSRCIMESWYTRQIDRVDFGEIKELAKLLAVEQDSAVAGGCV